MAAAAAGSCSASKRCKRAIIAVPPPLQAECENTVGGMGSYWSVQLYNTKSVCDKRPKHHGFNGKISTHVCREQHTKSADEGFVLSVVFEQYFGFVLDTSGLCRTSFLHKNKHTNTNTQQKVTKPLLLSARGRTENSLNAKQTLRFVFCSTPHDGQGCCAAVAGANRNFCPPHIARARHRERASSNGSIRCVGDTCESMPQCLT